MNLIRKILNRMVGPFDEVVTKSLIVRDENHRERVCIGTAPDGSAAVSLRDKMGKVRAALSMAGDERPALDLFDSVGRARVTIVVGLDGVPAMNLKDAQGTLCASIMVVKGGPVLLLTRPGVGVVKVAVPGRDVTAMSPDEFHALAKEIAAAESTSAVEDAIVGTLGHGPNVVELREENGVLVWGVPNISK